MRFNIFILLLSVLLIGCKNSTKKNPSDPRWPESMQQLSVGLSTLLPLSLDPVAFNDPSNKDTIEREMARLSHFGEHLQHVKEKPTSDPGVQFAAEAFGREMQDAQVLYRQGQTGQARHLIRGATNYCISCHTQSGRGPEFLWAPSGEYFANLNPLDRAGYLFAVRNFDAGLQTFEKAFAQPDIALESFPSVERATLKALAVAVRVKKDAKLAESVINRVVDSKWAPVYLQMSALKWRASVQNWKKNPDENQSLAEAKRLLSRAWTAQMESPLARAGLIESLRASSILHELLQQKTPGKAYAETLYYAGLSAESLKDLDLYNLSEHYYESCIRHLPHTPTSKNCYLRLESNLLSLYSTQDSLSSMRSLRDRMDALKDLALPTGKSWKE